MTTIDNVIAPDAVYTLREACRFLRVSEATMRRWIKRGRVRARKVGRDYRFLGRDLLHCLESAATASSPMPFRPSYPDHPLLALAGVGESGRADIAEEHDRYLAGGARNTS